MPGPNDPYSNFIPMQAYMNANPDTMKDFGTAYRKDSSTGGPTAGDYNSLNGSSSKDSFDLLMKDSKARGEETQGEGQLDASLFGAYSHQTPGATENEKKKKAEPDPDNPMPRTDTGAPAGKGAPRGKFPGTGGAGAADDQNNVYDNTANFNPMMAQMKMAQMGMGGGY